MMPMSRSIAAILVLTLTGIGAAQEVKPADKKPSRPSIYDVKADAREQVKAATKLATRDARRVLVMFGGDWCGWCHKLHDLFASDRQIRSLLAEEYVVVMVDTQAPSAPEVLAEYRGDMTGVGFPFLVVLDGQGKVVTRQKTDPLEEGDHHDPAKVKGFLDQWVAPKAVASQVLDNALARASSEDKRVFLHFGSPTCGWCHKLDGFLAREDIAPIIAKEFVDVKLDLARMVGADEVLKKYNKDESGGVPWFVFTDARGQAIVTSDGPKGNIGYPASPEEISHFMNMLRKVARKITPAQLDEIESALKAEGKKLDQTRLGADRPASTN